MEASALHAPAGVSRLRNPAGASFLRLRSDDQLVDLFRAGHEEAFRVIHDRYRARLFAYMRQMLSGSRQDAEDALQDVFIRAYSGLRANDRHLALRAWLYRVAHNRCVDQLRKNMPILTEEIEATSQDVSTDPIAAMQQREELRKLITDVQRLPEQQRSALLLRELSGMSYQELADSLELSIPAIKSLLVRARGGLAAAAEARDTDCSQIRGEIVDSHERGARPNALTRRHLSDCTACREYRESVRSVSKSLAALIPAGPLILAAKLLGVGTAYSAAAYSSGGAAAGGAAAGAAAGAGAGAAAVGGAATGGAAAGGAAPAAGGAAATGAVAGGVAASGAAVAGGVSAAHIAAIIAAAAAAGGAVAVTDQSSTHHASAPLHPASSVIRQAVKSGVTHGYAPAAVAPVAPITAVTPATAPANAAASTIANAVVTKLKHQATTPATATTSAATTSTTATTSSAGVTATTGSGGSSLAATASPTTGPATATGGASAAATTSAPTSTAPASSSTVATTSSAPATTAGTSSAASTTPVHTDSTAASSATTAGSSTSPNATASPTNSAASTPPPTS
jgi:RNA polymerase sigma factor (sigma-70 family)